MRRLLLMASIWAVVFARPEMYREKEDFQYSRSSSDEGSKSGYYGAQRGNMGGNYERAHNMDGLAQHQMSSAVRQVEGELGDGAKSRTGSVYTSANSRGVFGSGHYDLSNLKGRNFEESDFGSHSSLTSSAYGSGFTKNGYHSLSSDSLASQNGYHATSNVGNSGYHSLSSQSGATSLGSHNSEYHSLSSHSAGTSLDSENLGYHSLTSHNADADNLVSHGYILAPENTGLVSHNAGYGSGFTKSSTHSSGYHAADSRHTSTLAENSLAENIHDTDYSHAAGTGAKYYIRGTGQNQYEVRDSYGRRVDTPVRVVMRPGTIVTVPVTARAYDTAFVSNQNSLSEAEELSNADRHVYVKPSTVYNKPKHYESSYSYRKEWEKHNTEPAYIPTENPFPKNSELDEDSLLLQNAKSQYNALDSSSHSSNAIAHSFGSNVANAHSFSSSANTKSAAANKHHYESQALNAGAHSDAYTLGTHNSGAAVDANDLVENINTKPKSYHSSYSYHKSWERRGDPYVIKPIGPIDDQSQRLVSASANQGYSSHQHGSHYNNAHESFNQHGVDCDDNGHLRVTRSANPGYGHGFEEQVEDLGQQTQNQWDRLEDLGQQTQNHWDGLEDLGQQTQNHWDRLEDLGQQTQDAAADLTQQTQNQWDRLEDLGQQTQTQWDTAKQNLGQETQNQWGKLEDLGQQTQNQWDTAKQDLSQQTQHQWDKFKDLGQQTQNQWDAAKQDLSQQTQNQWGKLEDLGQQTQSQWDTAKQNLGQETQNQWDKLEDLGQQTQTQWHNFNSYHKPSVTEQKSQEILPFHQESISGEKEIPSFNQVEGLEQKANEEQNLWSQSQYIPPDISQSTDQKEFNLEDYPKVSDQEIQQQLEIQKQLISTMYDVLNKNKPNNSYKPISNTFYQQHHQNGGYSQYSYHQWSGAQHNSWENQHHTSHQTNRSPLDSFWNKLDNLDNSALNINKDKEENTDAQTSHLDWNNFDWGQIQGSHSYNTFELSKPNTPSNEATVAYSTTKEPLTQTIKPTEVPKFVKPIDIGRGDIDVDGSLSSIEDTENENKNFFIPKPNKHYKTPEEIESLSQTKPTEKPDKTVAVHEKHEINQGSSYTSYAGSDQRERTLQTTSTIKPQENKDLNQNNYRGTWNLVDKDYRVEETRKPKAVEIEQQNAEKIENFQQNQQSFDDLTQQSQSEWDHSALQKSLEQQLEDLNQHFTIDKPNENNDQQFEDLQQNLQSFDDLTQQTQWDQSELASHDKLEMNKHLEDFSKLGNQESLPNEEQQSQQLAQMEEFGNTQQESQSLLNFEQQSSWQEPEVIKHNQHQQTAELPKYAQSYKNFEEPGKTEKLEPTPKSVEIASPEEVTEKPGFWKSVGSKFTSAKDTVVSWFKSKS